MAAKNAKNTKGVSSTPPRTDTPVNVESPRGSIDFVPGTNEEKSGPTVINTAPGMKVGPTIEVQASTPAVEQRPEVEGDVSGLTTQAEEIQSRLSIESTRSSVPRESIESARPQHTETRSSIEVLDTEVPANVPGDNESLLKQLQSDFETSELQRQEEVHGYIERIDALQAKLQYLAKESAESAKKASNAAPAGSLEKKLADRDEQIALLMEEGQKLSKKELTHLTTIKKLRSKIQEDGKELAEAKKNQEQAEKDASFAADRLKRAEGSEKRVAEKQRLISQMQKDIESLRSQRDSRDLAIAGLKAQLEQAAAEEKEAEAKLANEALVTERKRVADLEEDVANLKIEKNLVLERAQTQMKELREKIEKDAERARITELEMKSEQQMLESKLEVMRARAEEVSTGATGDAQAKLLRQIETLQTQYAVTSENFQSIETSLIARAATLEKERDEATKREAEIRRKAREVVRSLVS
jgi:DNA repair exonuclease SbcCD ATPase subunit